MAVLNTFLTANILVVITFTHYGLATGNYDLIRDLYETKHYDCIINNNIRYDFYRKRF